ncbi:MAG: asparagine--tRNA ligase, partial [Clostridia bacterium]|nr:asparagine--tRNA ligase [Clostridia bacterium]
MLNVTDLRELLRSPEEFVGKSVTVQGWVRNHRKQKNFGFMMFYDGTITADMQIIYDTETPDFEGIQKITNGSAITVEGVFQTSPGAGQGYELKATAVKVEGTAPEDYPLQPKKHSLEFLRTIGHLRPRARLFQAAFRVRHVAAQAIHTYFRENNFVYVHSPIITANDAEGAG